MVVTCQPKYLHFGNERRRLYCRAQATGNSKQIWFWGMTWEGHWLRVWRSQFGAFCSRPSRLPWIACFSKSSACSCHSKGTLLLNCRKKGVSLGMNGRAATFQGIRSSLPNIIYWVWTMFLTLCEVLNIPHLTESSSNSWEVDIYSYRWANSGLERGSKWPKATKVGSGAVCNLQCEYIYPCIWLDGVSWWYWPAQSSGAQRQPTLVYHLDSLNCSIGSPILKD